MSGKANVRFPPIADVQSDTRSLISCLTCQQCFFGSSIDCRVARGRGKGSQVVCQRGVRYDSRSFKDWQCYCVAGKLGP